MVLGAVVVLAGVVEIAPGFVGAGGVAVAVPLGVPAGGGVIGAAAPVAGGVGKVVSGIGTSGNGFDRMPATSSFRPVSDLLRYL